MYGFFEEVLKKIWQTGFAHEEMEQDLKFRILDAVHTTLGNYCNVVGSYPKDAQDIMREDIDILFEVEKMIMDSFDIFEKEDWERKENS